MKIGRKRCYLLLCACILAGLAGTAIYVRWFRHGLPWDVRDALHGTNSWTLVSLDPKPEGIPQEDGVRKELLHGFVVLGRLPLSDPQPAIEAVGKLDRTYDANSFAMCFWPRHALETHLPNGKRLDLLICYECGQMRWYIDGHQEGIVNFPQMDATPLNKMLTVGGIPLPKQPE